MIGSAVGLSGILGTLTSDSNAIKSQLDTTLQQQSTGLVSHTYSGLGVNAQTSLDLNPEVAHLQTWQNNIAVASSRLDVTQATLTQIDQIATNFYAQTNNINNVGVSEVSTIASSAKLALQQVAQLLNTKVGDVYLFSGQDTGHPPIPNTDPAYLAAAVLAVPQTTSPFSTTISSSVSTIEVGEGQSVQIGLLANQNTLAVSTGTSTTGSYTRDILQGLATLAGLTTGPTAQAGAATAQKLLNGAITALSDEQGALGQIQSNLTQRQTNMAATQSALTTQLSNVQDVDAAATITKVQALQTQLQASYQLIAGVKSLSLSNFLPA
jgi:flagellar hook-associated protein 3 FlgL